jgi:glycine cleavage system aminomethyltransferase T
MTIENNPFEIMGLERLVEEQEADYIGKAALESIRARGVDRKLVGIEFEGDALPFEISRKLAARHDGETVGTVTDLIWSPRLGRNIGYVWVPFGLSKPDTALEIEAPDGSLWPATTAAIPFIDPRKVTPKS